MELTNYEMEEDLSNIFHDAEQEHLNWIAKHLMKSQHRLLCYVDEDFIEDAFNLYGLSQQEYFGEAVKLVLNSRHYKGVAPFLEERAEHFYGMIHARFILTEAGLQRMKVKFLDGEFGFCPSINCYSNRLLPIGLKDAPGCDVAKLFCPYCKAVYYNSGNENNHCSIDSAYIGRTFPNLFVLSFPELFQKPLRKYEPTIYGFRIHPTSPYWLGTAEYSNIYSSHHHGIWQSSSRPSSEAISDSETPTSGIEENDENTSSEV